MTIQAKVPLRVGRLIKVPGNGPFEIENKVGEKMIAFGIAARADGKAKGKTQGK